jgi:Tfp pilus assembly protein PilO
VNKILKNIQWFIVLLGLYNLYTIYEENDPKPQLARSQAEALKVKFEKNKKIKKELDFFYKNIEEAKLKIQKVKESVAKTQQLLPSEISDNENMSLLRHIAETLNIKAVEIIPSNEEGKGLFISKQYTFKANATYVQFLIMFEKIASNKRVLNIKNVTLRRVDSPQRARFLLLQGSFVLEAYRYNPNAKELEESSHNFPTSKGKTEGAG